MDWLLYDRDLRHERLNKGLISFKKDPLSKIIYCLSFRFIEEP